MNHPLLLIGAGVTFLLLATCNWNPAPAPVAVTPIAIEVKQAALPTEPEEIAVVEAPEPIRLAPVEVMADEPLKAPKPAHRLRKPVQHPPGKMHLKAPPLPRDRPQTPQYFLGIESLPIHMPRP